MIKFYPSSIMRKVGWRVGGWGRDWGGRPPALDRLILIQSDSGRWRPHLVVFISLYSSIASLWCKALCGKLMQNWRAWHLRASSYGHPSSRETYRRLSLVVPVDINAVDDGASLGKYTPSPVWPHQGMLAKGTASYIHKVCRALLAEIRIQECLPILECQWRKGAGAIFCTLMDRICNIHNVVCLYNLWLKVCR